MNKKVSKNFRYIHDIYLLQCLCTEYEDMCFTLHQKVEHLENIRKEAIEYIKEDMYGEPNELYGLVDGEYLLDILYKGNE